MCIYIFLILKWIYVFSSEYLYLYLYFRMYICICIVTKIVLYVKVIPISLFESDKLSWNLEAKISQKALALTFVYIWSKNVDHFKLMNYVTFLGCSKKKKCYVSCVNHSIFSLRIRATINNLLSFGFAQLTFK